MDIDRIVNKTVRDLKMAGLIGEDWVEHVKYHIHLACIAAQEQKVIETQRNHERPVISYRHGKKYGEHRSIREAARECGYGDRYRKGESIVLNVLSGRHPHTKEGFYFEYADNGNNHFEKENSSECGDELMEESIGHGDIPGEKSERV